MLTVKNALFGTRNTESTGNARTSSLSWAITSPTGWSYNGILAVICAFAAYGPSSCYTITTRWPFNAKSPLVAISIEYEC